jgi:hypothetical protein
MTPKYYLTAPRGTELAELIASVERADDSVVGFVFNEVAVRRGRGDSRATLTERYRKKTDDRKKEKVT